MANGIASLFSNCLATTVSIQTDDVGINLSFAINCTKTFFFRLVSGATERKRQTSRQVCQVSILLRLQGVKVNRDNKNSNSNYNSMSNVR